MLRRPSGVRRKRPRRLGFSPIKIRFGAILLVGNTFSFAPGPTNNNDDPFNPTDFAPSCNPSPTLNLNNPTTHAAPVPVTCTETSGPKAVTVNWISDTVSGTSTDDAWGQGDKSDCFLA